MVAPVVAVVVVVVKTQKLLKKKKLGSSNGQFQIENLQHCLEEYCYYKKKKLPRHLFVERLFWVAMPWEEENSLKDLNLEDWKLAMRVKEECWLKLFDHLLVQPNSCSCCCFHMFELKYCWNYQILLCCWISHWSLIIQCLQIHSQLSLDHREMREKAERMMIAVAFLVCCASETPCKLPILPGEIKESKHMIHKLKIDFNLKTYKIVCMVTV